MSRLRSSLVAIASCAVLLVAGPASGVVSQDESTSVTHWAPFENGPWSSIGNGGGLFGTVVLEDGSVVVVGGPLLGELTSWTTSDGISWTASDPLDTAGLGPQGVAPTPWGAALFGNTVAGFGSKQGYASVVLDSSDGLEWSSSKPVKKSVIIQGSSGADAMYWAGGVGKQPKLVPAIWRSSDGQTYERLLLEAVGKPGYATSVAELPNGELLVVAKTGKRGKPRLHRGTWGGEWEPVHWPTKSTGLGNLASTPDGVVLGMGASLWFTADGAEWEAVSEVKNLGRLLQTRDGLYTVPRVQMSFDGTDWCALGRPGSARDSITGISRLPDGRLLAVGWGTTKAKKNRGSNFGPVAFVADSPSCLGLESIASEDLKTEAPTEVPTEALPDS